MEINLDGHILQLILVYNFQFNDVLLFATMDNNNENSKI
jgi:hypothetical protein